MRKGPIPPLPEDGPPSPARPPLKWAGGKRWQVPRLRDLWMPHAHRRLVEPFCGGLAVTLGLSPRRALLNDVNPHLINFYRWARRGLTIDLPMRERPPRRSTRTATGSTRWWPRPRGQPRGGCALLLSEPDRLQRPVPVQRPRRVQRPVRTLHAPRLPPRLLGRSVRCPRAGRSGLAISRTCRFVRTTSSTPTRPTTCRSRATPGRPSRGRTRCAPPSGWRRIRAPSCSPTRRPTGFAASIPAWGTHVTDLAAPRRISCTGDRSAAAEVLAIRNVLP